jgi:hypothetical protein
MANELPNKLSELIVVALDDLEKVRADERYAVNLDYWHVSKNSNASPTPGKCVVCFAGAVMAGTLGLNPEESCGGTVERFGADSSDKLSTLDLLRMGCVNDGLGVWPGGLPEAVENDFAHAPSISEYDRHDLDAPENYERFRREMNALASWLAERGA